jgi:predicted phage terminase large subunit-like protein
MVGCALKELAIGFTREVMQYLENPELRKYVWDTRPHITGRLVPDVDRSGSKRKRASSSTTLGMRDDDTYGGEAFDGEDGLGNKVVWRANALQVNRSKIFKEPTLFACSLGVIMTGWHYDLALFDDIVTFENSKTPDAAHKVLSWVRDVESVLNPRNESTGLGDETVILGTRYYKHDYYAHLLGTDLESDELATEFIDTLSDDPLHIIVRDIYGNGCKGRLYAPTTVDALGVPKELEGSTEYMCPRIMNANKEAKLRRRLGARRFASQYLNQILAVEERIFKWENIKWLHPLGVERDGEFIRIKKTNELMEKPVFIKPWCVVDPAASLRESADYTTITVGGVDESGNLYVLDVKYGHFTSTQTANHLKTMLEKWELNVCVLETTGMQVSLKQTIEEVWKRAGFGAHIISDIPKGSKKQNILDVLEPLFEGGFIWFMNWLGSLKDLQEQLEFFPAAGTRDDFLDTLIKLVKYCKPVRTSTVEKRRQRKRLSKKRTGKYGGVR